MNIDIPAENGGMQAITVADAYARGVPHVVIGVAMKKAMRIKVRETANGYRAAVSSTSAGKLAEYRIKEEIARDPASASETQLALLTREAASRGKDLDWLLALILKKAAIYRDTALLIAVLEAEAKAAIKAIPDDAPDLGMQLKAAMADAQTAAQVAFGEAAAQIAA